MIWLKLFPIIAEAARKVAPDYQRMATDACMMEIVRQMLIDKQVK